MDSDQPRAALIELLVQRQAGGAAQKPTPQPEPEPDASGGGTSALEGDGAGTGAAARIVAGIQGDKAQREAAYVQLEALARGDSSGIAAAGSASANGGGEREALVDVAAECVGPLMETVFAAEVSVVDAAEFRRAHLVLAELFAQEPLRLIGEWTRDLRMSLSWGTPGNAWAAVFDKEPSELTREDVLTVATSLAPHCAHIARGAPSGSAVSLFRFRLNSSCAGVSLTNQAGGIDDMQWMGEWSTDARGGQSGGCRLVATVTEPPTPDAFFERLCLLALEVVQSVLSTVEMAAGPMLRGEEQDCVVPALVSDGDVALVLSVVGFAGAKSTVPIGVLPTCPAALSQRRGWSHRRCGVGRGKLAAGDEGGSWRQFDPGGGGKTVAAS